MAFLGRRHRVSERQACKVVRAHRSTHRYVAVPGDFENRLVKLIRAHAEAHPRWRYRRVHAPVDEAWAVNVKRAPALGREGLNVLKVGEHRGQKARGGDANSA